MKKRQFSGMRKTKNTCSDSEIVSRDFRTMKSVNCIYYPLLLLLLLLSNTVVTFTLASSDSVEEENSTSYQYLTNNEAASNSVIVFPDSSESDGVNKTATDILVFPDTTPNTEEPAKQRGIFRPKETTTSKPKEIYGCPPDHKLPCVAKCCDVHQSYSLETKAVCVNQSAFFNPQFLDCPEFANKAGLPIEERYEYFIGNPCLHGKYLLEPENNPDEKFFLLSNGSLWMGNQFLSMADYCMETLDNETRAFVCFEEQMTRTAQFQYILYPIGLLISIPFLISTAVIYTCFEVLRDVQGKALSCHVCCLAIGYFFLALVQLASDQFNDDACIATAFIIQFFFVACFFWLNVLCFDTWRNIQTDYRMILKQNQSRSGKKRFILYSLYAWYGPSMLLIVSLVMDLEPAVPESFIKPHFGLRSCWFSSDAAALPYFYGPVGILIFINLILFLLSVRKIYKEQKGVLAQPLRHSISVEEKRTEQQVRCRINRQALKQIGLLFAVMGINWVVEVLSWAIGGPIYIWIVTDIFNTFQGLLIFYIFVLREARVRNLVKDYLEPKCRCLFRRNSSRSSISNEETSMQFNDNGTKES